MFNGLLSRFETFTATEYHGYNLFDFIKNKFQIIEEIECEKEYDKRVTFKNGITFTKVAGTNWFKQTFTFPDISFMKDSCYSI